MTTPLVRVEGLVKHYAQGSGLWRRGSVVRAVDGVSFTVAPGETLGLVGESGSGKSTVGRAVLHLEAPTAGRVRFDGHELAMLPAAELRALRRRMQVVFQDPFGSLNPRRTIGASIAEGLEIHGIVPRAALRDRVAALLAEVGLDAGYADRYPHEFSGGQRQRIGIARALAVEPAFVVLDEPVSALDVSVQAQVLNLLLDLRERRGLAYLFIAHDLAVVRQVAHRVAVMYLGTIVEIGPARTVISAPRHPYTQALVSAVPDPDPARQRERIVLAGEPPSPSAPPPGCPFAPRCFHPARDARCTSERPSLRVLHDREVACHYAS
ncbi:MAG TPA: oligopeptide/dipeptide ABC transporter ATP-binding protein [Gemmatimonadales bacterium]|nr:oligopeptide/dipeptide ABC transporter ATP-binding protein [Gemmatimonadales bacterium]